MTSLAGAVALGFLSSAHCVGMCGGFAVAIGSAGQSIHRTIARQLIYSGGRIFTYGFLGALAGAAGQYLSRYDTVMIGVQQAFSMVAGVLMLILGASVLGLFRFRWAGVSLFGKLVGPAYRQFLSAGSWTGYFLAGLANGFLPCGLVYAFVTMAVASASMVEGAELMACFGVGTVPAMVAVGCGGSLLSQATRGKIYRVAACFVMLAGVITIWRAVPLSGCSHCVEHTIAAQDSATGRTDVASAASPWTTTESVRTRALARLIAREAYGCGSSRDVSDRAV